MVTELLYETMFKKDIKCLDTSRHIFQYKTEVNNKEMIIKDIKNYKVLNKIAKNYRKMTDFHLNNILLRVPSEDEEIDYDIVERATNKANEHYATTDNINRWAHSWLMTVGK